MIIQNVYRKVGNSKGLSSVLLVVFFQSEVILRFTLHVIFIKSQKIKMCNNFAGFE